MLPGGNKLGDAVYEEEIRTQPTVHKLKRRMRLHKRKKGHPKKNLRRHLCDSNTFCMLDFGLVFMRFTVYYVPRSRAVRC